MKALSFISIPVVLLAAAVIALVLQPVMSFYQNAPSPALPAWSSGASMQAESSAGQMLTATDRALTQLHKGALGKTVSSPLDGRSTGTLNKQGLTIAYSFISADSLCSLGLHVWFHIVNESKTDTQTTEFKNEPPIQNRNCTLGDIFKAIFEIGKSALTKGIPAELVREMYQEVWVKIATDFKLDQTRNLILEILNMK